MREIEAAELKTILEEHDKWLRSGGKEGRRAVLSGADLRDADLRRADLSDADLSIPKAEKPYTQMLGRVTAQP